MDSYLSFWGKAQPQAHGAQQWHPAAYHCLDVAACGRMLLKQNDLWRTRLGELLQLNDKDLLDFITFLFALHDIGKFSKPFQAIVPQHWPSDVLGPWQPKTNSPRHDTAGWWLWREKLEKAFSEHLIGIDQGKFDLLIKSVVGHHGTPPQDNVYKYTELDIDPKCIKAAHAFASDAAGLFLSQPINLSNSEDNDKDIAYASWLLAGLTTLADWIGSNQNWFSYCAPDLSCHDYWQTIALKKASEAVAQAGLSPRSCTPCVTYQDLAGFNTPNPMQKWAQETSLMEEPTLYLIEDMTGSGKTEVALMLAHRLMADGKADGLFFALPTQATANAIYERLAEAYRKLFQPEAKPSLVLAHGSRDLMEKFTASKFTPSLLDGFSSLHENYEKSAEDSELTASGQCAAWVADDRRLAFLADVGAGTIDQALLSILPSRHQALRLAGLMRRVLILDEVHAYDAYMQVEIKRLLEFHRALGGSAILLSATLPSDMKAKFCEAYGDEVYAPPISPQDSAYPLATMASAKGAQTFPIEPRQGSARRVLVKFLASPEEGLEKVRAAAKEGQAVLYIRNTVNDAIEAFNHLNHDIETLTLFHARFAFCDRLRHESRVVDTFGKHSKQKGRHSHVLVATQVVEQSLDLDFDLIVSDLAPIDLLIQRAGRLWRHKRENRPGKCEFLIVSPEPIAEPDKNWLRSVLPGTAAVYKDHARLWLTAKILKQKGAIHSPDDLRFLIETVYGVDAENNIPQSLMESFYDFEGSQGADRGLGVMNTLKLNSGYEREDNTSWGSDEYTPTRLGDAVTTFRLARVEEGQLRPWTESEENASVNELLLWRLSEVSLSNRLATDCVIPAAYAAQEKEIRKSWGKWQEEKKLLILQKDETPNLWRGTVLINEKQKSVVYSPNKGLILQD